MTTMIDLTDINRLSIPHDAAVKLSRPCRIVAPDEATREGDYWVAERGWGYALPKREFIPLQDFDVGRCFDGKFAPDPVVVRPL